MRGDQRWRRALGLGALAVVLMLVGAAAVAEPSAPGATASSMTTLVASPSTIEFGVVYAEAPIQVAERTVRITNTATPPADPVQFTVLVPGTSGNGWFSLPAGDAGYLGPGEAQDFTIRFTWIAGVVSTSPLVLASAIATEPPVEVPMFAEAAYGNLVFDDPPAPWAGIALAPVPFGQPATYTIRAHNDGHYELLIESAYAQVSFGGTAELQGATSYARLAPGASISWMLVCTPDGLDGYDGVSGNLSLNYNYAAHDFDYLPLWCPGLSPRLTTDPAGLQFDDVAIGAVKALPVRVINSGNQPAELVAITSDLPAFTAAAALPVTLAIGAELTVDVRYAPTASGLATGTITFDAATGFDASLAVAGTGFAAAAEVTPAAHDFGAIAATGGASQAFALHNASERALTITTVAIDAPGDFSTTLTTGTVIAAGATATFDVDATPSRLGQRHATLAIATDLVAPLVIPLDLIAFDAALEVTTDDAIAADFALDLGAVDVDVGARTGHVTLHNLGASAVELATCARTGDDAFVLTTACPLTLAAGASVALAVAFDPAAEASYHGALTITGTGFATGAIAIAVTGTGRDQHLALSTLAVVFPDTFRHPRAPTTRVVTVHNTDTAPLTITAITVDGDGFATSGAGSVTLAPDATADVAIEFAPPAIGAFTGHLVLGNADDPAIARIDLSGAGVARAISVTPTAIDLGTVAIGTTVAISDLAPGAIALANLDATATFAISAVTLDGDAGFALIAPLPTTIAPGARASIDVALTPTVAGALTATVDVFADGDPLAVARVTLTATAVDGSGPSGCGCAGGPAGGALAPLALIALAASRRRRVGGAPRV